MKSKLKVGDKIVCINVDGADETLEYGEVLIITDTDYCIDSEFINGYFAWRFTSLQGFRKIKLEKLNEGIV